MNLLRGRFRVSARVAFAHKELVSGRTGGRPVQAFGVVCIRSLWCRLTPCLVGCIILTACSESPEERSRISELSKIRKVALIGFAGRSPVSTAKGFHAPLLKAAFDGFWAQTGSDPSTITFVPIEQTVADAKYREFAAALPNGVLSPIAGLSYLSSGTTDCGPLVLSLGVDALLVVVGEFGYTSRNSGSEHYLTTKLMPTLVKPRASLIWGDPKSPMVEEEELVDVSVTANPKLFASLSARWIVMAPPSESDYGEMVQIAEKKSFASARAAGAQLFTKFKNDLLSARARQAR
jgi:hypothetical protein